MSKEVKITKIEKSWKFTDSVMVATSKSKLLKRKFYEKHGKILVIFDYEVYSFQWDMFDNTKGTNIKWEYTLKDKTKEELPDDNEILEEVIKAPKVHTPIIVDANGDVKHEKFLQIKTCVESDIPVYLVGPAGSGKNFTLEQIAKELDLDFYFTNSVQQEYKLTGFIDAGGIFHDTEFYKAFTSGGLFFLDEMDASIPEVLVLLNAAIANKYFEFPTGKVNAHKDFRVVSAGNTVGNGADEQYVGRLTLDQATLDRFVIIEFDYSEKIEITLAKGNTELVEFVHQLRAESKLKGIRSTFSYRCITMVQKLEGKLELTEILVMAIFKGMDKDTVNTFKVPGISKYHRAMHKVQA